MAGRRRLGRWYSEGLDALMLSNWEEVKILKHDSELHLDFEAPWFTLESLVLVLVW